MITLLEAKIPPHATPDASVPVMCNSVGVALSGGSCVSTESDPDHCGGCDKACATGEACEGGFCAALCQIDGKQVAAGAVNAANSCEAWRSAGRTTRSPRRSR